MRDMPVRETAQVEEKTLTPSTLRCLLMILEISGDKREIASREIAERLGVKPPSICRILDILLREGLIRKEPYGKVELTEIGRETANEFNDRVIRFRYIVAQQLGLTEEDNMQTALYFVTNISKEGQNTVFAHAESKIKGGDRVMPLNLAAQGENNIIRKIGGTTEVRKHLSDLGFVVGGTVSIVARTGGNLIVNVKESRIAISGEMTQRIMV